MFSFKNSELDGIEVTNHSAHTSSAPGLRGVVFRADFDSSQIVAACRVSWGLSDTETRELSESFNRFQFKGMTFGEVARAMGWDSLIA